MKGLECYALRNFPTWNASIIGLEAMSGKRFTRDAVMASVGHPMGNPLEVRRDSILRDIESRQRRIREQEQALQTVADGYVDWSEETS